jgi:short-subunit dehydrogenase
VVKLDLASLASVRQCAQDLLRTERQIHILVNNAGKGDKHPCTEQECL